MCALIRTNNMKPLLCGFTLRLFALCALLGILMPAAVRAQNGPTPFVQTDQADYPPGGLVIITGGGFAPGEMVQLQVLHIPDTGDNNTSPAHQPWTVTADADRNISTTSDVPFDA